MGLGALKTALVGESAFTARVSQGPTTGGSFHRIMMIQAGSGFAGTAYIGPGTYPAAPGYQREKGSAIVWGTLCATKGSLTHARTVPAPCQH